MSDWSSAVIENGMLGEIHVPRIGPTESILIGKYLGNIDNPEFNFGGVFEQALCECRPWVAPTCRSLCGDVTFEETPRDVEYPRLCGNIPGEAGRIWIRETGGLKGQIVVNALNIPNPTHVNLWSGYVQVGTVPATPDCAQLTLGPSPIAQPRQAPFYSTLSVSLGAGAVGLVPFAVHSFESSPVAVPGGGTRFIEDFYALNKHIEIEFYGPLLDAAPGDKPPVIIELDLMGMGFFDVTEYFAVSVVGRRVVISAPLINPVQLSGRFRVREREEELVCDKVLSTIAVPVKFEYLFKMYPDCNENQIGDPDEIESGMVQDCNHNLIPDICEGTVPCDGACPADFNHDGSLDPDDLADYIGCYFSVPPCSGADFNGDTVVDPDDLADYIGAFFAGCG